MSKYKMPIQNNFGGLSKFILPFQNNIGGFSKYGWQYYFRFAGLSKYKTCIDLVLLSVIHLQSLQKQNAM